MKKVVLHKTHNPILGIWGWSAEEKNDYQNLIFSDPYYVEMPDDFYPEETTLGKTMFFKKGCNVGYKLTIGRNSENGSPYLVGGRPVESIKLKVLGAVEEDKR